MYEEKLMAKQPVKEQPGHLSIAERFANEIIDEFNPDQVNEVLKCIRSIFLDNREIAIQDTQRKLEYLQETFQDLKNN